MSILQAVALAVGAAAGAAGVVFGLVRARSDLTTTALAEQAAGRDEVAAVIGLKDEMITSLREANDELRVQLQTALAREDRWERDREEMRGRLATMEKSYQRIVEAIVDAGICAIANTCPSRVMPGDRRNGTTPT